MILRPNQPGALVSPATAAFLNRHANLSAIRVKALNPGLDQRVAQELLDLKHIALEHEPLPEAEVGSPEAARGLEQQWLSSTDVAGLLGISDSAVRLACREDRIQGARRVGGRWQINRQAVEDYKAARAA